MEVNTTFERLADDEAVERTAQALQQNGIEAIVTATGAQAKQKAIELLPQDAEVMNMTSMTLESISLADEILESGNYTPIRKQLEQMDDEKDAERKQERGAAPPWVIGSVHAITEQGEVIIASNTGSQLPAYAYGSTRVIWIAGTHKIVPDLETGIRRIYEYSYPLEDERARKAYGVPSGVSKLLIFNKEKTEGRITLILVKEKLGF